MDHFYETAKRMYKSSQTLHANSEYHNACYLAGYVVECYAKIIIGYGQSMNAVQLRQFSHNLNNMNARLVQYITQNSQYAVYSLDMSVELPNIMSWSPFNRYSDAASQWSSANSNDFQNEIPKVMAQLAQLSINTSSNLI